jgi:geranylgeranyl reductase
VRDEAEVNAMLAVSTIKGGIRVGGQKGQTQNDQTQNDREPALAAK